MSNKRGEAKAREKYRSLKLYHRNIFGFSLSLTRSNQALKLTPDLFNGIYFDAATARKQGNEASNVKCESKGNKVLCRHGGNFPKNFSTLN